MPVMTRAKPTDLLEAAINLESYEWLADHVPALLEAVEGAVHSGMSPHAIGRYMRKELGADRLAIAKRCEQAAAYVQASSDQ